jgi:hypothetical protein
MPCWLWPQCVCIACSWQPVHRAPIRGLGSSFMCWYTANAFLQIQYVLGIDAAPAPRPQISKFPVDVPLTLTLTGTWNASGGTLTAPDADACKVWWARLWFPHNMLCIHPSKPHRLALSAAAVPCESIPEHLSKSRAVYMTKQSTTIPAAVNGTVALTVRSGNCGAGTQLLNVLNAGM